MTTANKKLKSLLLLYTSVAACLLSILVFGFLLISNGYSQNKAFASSYTTDQIILIVNHERSKKNLPWLTINSQLQQSAQKKSEDMANKGYFSHIYHVENNQDKKWSDFIKDSGYDYSIAAENLAKGFNNAGDMIEAWMNSPTHRENILNDKVTETGIGISAGKLDNVPTIFVTQHFGTKAVKI